jgi:DNA-binding transcriptional ArsR family regulator
MSDTTTPGDLVADLDYSADGGGTWVMIATGVIRPQGLNGYTWLVPSIDATGVNVRVCASDGALRACSTSPGFTVDSTPPAVIATVPQEGVSNVAVGQPLVITFSEAIDTAAFPPSGVRIFPPVTGLTVAWSSGLATLTVAHSVFAPCTMYTARVDAAEDGSDPGIPVPFVYSWSFSTVCTPAAAFLGPLGGEDWTGGSTHVVRFRVTDEADAQVWAWLNATIDGTETALYAGLVAVGETALSWTVPVSSGTAMLRLEVVDSSALTATAMTGAFEIDATPPTLLSTEPTDGLSGVQVGAPLILTFSERMNATATQSAIRIAPPAGTMDFTWGAGFSVLIIRFAAPLAVNTSYVLAVGCEALDDSDPGNPVAGCPATTTEIAFRTEPAPPFAAAVADVDVRVGVPVTFDGRGSTGAIVRYAWTIWDALESVVATLEGPVVTHTFAKTGTHTVTLQVTDMFGRTDEYVFDVTVQAVVGVDGGGWMLVLVGALATATILFTTSEPGRVALMTATSARAYGRRRKDEKDSELRGAMLYYVRVHPGDCYMDIKRNLDLNDGVVTYHLARLEKEGLIRSAIRGARRRYYPAEMRVPLENGGELHEIQQRILHFVGEAPGVPVAVLAEQLGVSNQLALYHLRKLSQGQRVELERAGLRLRAYPGRTKQ